MKKNVLLFLFSAVAVSAFADPSVTGITVKQRWPWSDKIDVDFTLSATTNCDIRFAFSHSGTATGKTVVKNLSDVTLSGVAPGEGHFTMDPADFGIKGKSIANLVVTAEEVASVADRTFLVLDLSTGEYEYRAARPSDELGWTNSVYKSTKMPFRRVSAGTYTVGHTEAEMKTINNGTNPSADQKNSILQRQVTLSSDYYIAIFPLTAMQSKTVGYGSDTGYGVKRMSYGSCRGLTNADESVNVNWPITGLGKFGENTLLAKIRQRTGGKLMIDLPTETQYEVAMRAGTTTIFPNGGTSSNTKAELEDLWLELSPPYPPGQEDVGLRKPNGWDIYNPVGMTYYWCLDAERKTAATYYEDNTSAGQSGTDPYGETIAVGDPLVRLARGNGYQSGGSLGSLPGTRRAQDMSSSSKATVRLAIHLADPRIRQ